MNYKTTKLRDAIVFAFAAGATALAGTGVAFAQEADQDEQEQEATELDRIVVTGSRISRSDIEGAVPVTVIDREQIELSGESSVADVIRGSTFNSFGSFRPQSGSSAQSFAGISLRGLGTNRTLILIDGRRLPTAPNVGSAQDLNSVPLAAVERIEILSSGASAIYGSDAIGGVVNIITRSDFEGVEISAEIGRPSTQGGDTEAGSVIFGAAGERGSMTGGVSFNNREIIFQGEREFSRGGASVFSNNLLSAIPNPDSLYGFVPGGFLDNPTYGTALPEACNGPGFTLNPAGDTCFYDFTFVAADEAALKNRSLFLRGDFQINDDWSSYFNSSVSRVKSFGRYAPVPSSPWPGGFPFIPVDSPNHPAERFPEAGYDPDSPYFLLHRFAAGGNRDTFIDSQLYDAGLGFQGHIGRVDLDFGIRKTESIYNETGTGYIVGGLAQEAIANGTYDIYDPFAVDPALLGSFTSNISRQSEFVFDEIYGTASFDLFEMGGGTAAMAVGVEHRDITFADLYDSLSESGQIVGSAGNSSSGTRQVSAAYFEVLLPFFTGFEANLAGRYDSYSDYGNEFSPKLSLRWQPFDELTFRGSYGEGFRAPTLDILNAQPAFSAAGIAHPETCEAFGLDPTCQTQVTTFQIANPALSSEQSEQFSLGLAWQPLDWLDMTVDYYNIDITNQVSFIGIGTIVGCLEGTIDICPTGLSSFPSNTVLPDPSLGLGVVFGPEGQISGGQTGFGNLGTIETYGFDYNVNTRFDLGAFGLLRQRLQITNPLSFRVNGADSVIGRPDSPRYRAVFNNILDVNDFTFGWNVNYIHSTFSNAGRDCLNDSESSACALPGDLPSFLTHDVQVSYHAPWNGTITLGVQNVSDKGPVLDPLHPSGRGYSFALYDSYGRVPYLRYQQSF